MNTNADAAHLNNIRTELVALNANVKALVEETRTANLLAFMASEHSLVPEKLQMASLVRSRLR